MEALTALNTLAAHPDGRRRTDGRNRRAERSREALLKACRERMVQGSLRPTARDVAIVAGVSVRTLFSTFGGGGVEIMWREALDEPTKRAVLSLIVRDSLFPQPADCDRIVRAAVFGEA